MRLAAAVGLTAPDLTQAFRLRRELTTFVNVEIFGQHDAIITANGLCPAPRLDSFPVDVPPKQTLHTIPFNVTGNPALAVPTGFSPSGLPLGMQVVGRAFDEATVLRIGAAYEAAAGHVHKRPALELPIAV